MITASGCGCSRQPNYLMVVTTGLRLGKLGAGGLGGKKPICRSKCSNDSRYTRARAWNRCFWVPIVVPDQRSELTDEKSLRAKRNSACRACVPRPTILTPSSAPAAARESHLGMAPDIMRSGRGARDPHMVSSSAYGR